ncbi:MAG: FlgD immunoglobulin-like domain containing protein, partial [bacterium]
DTASGDTLAQGGPYSSPKFGHILAGIRYPAPDSLGTVLLLVDESVASPLSAEIERLELDMIRDGRRVERRSVSADATVPEVKSLIVSECQSDPTISTLFLLGSIAIPYSGDVRGAHANEFGAWAADTYYGELDGVWTDSVVNNTSASRIENHNVPGDGKFDQTYLPSPVELQVGRVDLSNLPAFPEGEVELLRRYLNKDHAYRSGQVLVPRRGLIKDGTGEMSGTAYACTAWRNYTAMFGPSSLNVGLWLPALETNPYLCAFGSGAGSFTSCAMVISTNDYVTKTIYAVFQMLMGSYFGEWDATDNLMRASLASAGYGLACFWAGHPAWHLHHMALGYPIGYSARLTQNNHTDYMIGYGGMQTSIALMGDPTIRLHTVKPPAGLSLACLGDGSIGLTWGAPADSVLGYHVYRAGDVRGDFARLTGEPIADTTFSDWSPLPGSNTYMVRAVRLEATGSGTYLNLSPGVIDSIDVVAGVESGGGSLPDERSVVQGSPNPFGGEAALRLYVPRRAEVAIEIHDVAGRLVRNLDLGPREPGWHACRWDGRDSHGRQVASGVYYLSVTAGRAALSTKLVRIE